MLTLCSSIPGIVRLMWIPTGVFLAPAGVNRNIIIRRAVRLTVNYDHVSISPTTPIQLHRYLPYRALSYENRLTFNRKLLRRGYPNPRRSCVPSAFAFDVTTTGNAEIVHGSQLCHHAAFAQRSSRSGRRYS